jgi:murein DD-endopeptidase MepM/ murein hydrolase activator NlpD
MPPVTRLNSPLDALRITQLFGKNYLDYGQFGMKGHNGLDLACPVGTKVYATHSGDIYTTNNPGGYGLVVWIRNKELGIETVYGHLSELAAGIKNGEPVRAGQVIALSGNSGFSTGPHLHFGIRRIYWIAGGAGPYIRDYENGYFGYIDPLPYFNDGVFDLAVDNGYNLKPAKSEWDWYKDAVWFYTQTRRLPTVREKKAMLYGRWDMRTVLDPAMFDTWSRWSKPEAKLRKAI